MRRMAMVLVLLFVVPMLSVGQVTAEADIGLEEAGITMVALRNDTLDLNQDGDIDAVRVVVILNSPSNRPLSTFVLSLPTTTEKSLNRQPSR